MELGGGCGREWGRHGRVGRRAVNVAKVRDVVDFLSVWERTFGVPASRLGMLGNLVIMSGCGCG